MIQRNVESVGEVIDGFLRGRDLYQNGRCWTLGKSMFGGIGVFASRDIECGEEVFKDFPIIIGPRVLPNNPILFCVVCYKVNNLIMCSNKCGLPICSQECELTHQDLCTLIRNKRLKEVHDLDLCLFNNLTPLNSLLLKPEDKLVVSHLKGHKDSIHGFEVNKLKETGLTFDIHEEEFLKFVCCVMDTNAFEVSFESGGDRLSFKGLYPLASLINHSCTPNINHTFNKNQLMIATANCCIPRGSELTHSYVRLIWSTPSRQYHLFRTKHFVCHCPRCSDITEFGSYMSAFLCKICKGKVVSKNPLTLKSDWFCEDCGVEVKRLEIANLMSSLGSILKSFSGENLEIMLKFLTGKLANLVHPNNEVAVELKYKIIWIIGYHEKYRWKDIDETLIRTKQEICKDLLALVEKLRLGECTLKGLLLNELYLCIKEIHKRESANAADEFVKNGTDEISETLKKAAMILKGDVVFDALT